MKCTAALACVLALAMLLTGCKKPVDTVAAGDSFNAALAVAITEGKSLYEALRFANAMGALTVQVKGAIPSLHSREKVEEFLHSRA